MTKLFLNSRLIVFIFIFLTIIVAIASITFGEVFFSINDIWLALCGKGEAANRIILFDIRLPRTLVGLVTGAALSASGAIMQAFFRNPLASPGLLGVSSGGALGAVLALVFGTLYFSSISALITPVASIIGAFLATGLVMFLGSKGSSPERLLLAGIALNALFGAATSFLLSISATQTQLGAQILFWLMGGIENRTWEHVWIVVPAILLFSMLLLPLAGSMNLLSLGDSGAQSLGVNVKRLRWQLVIISTVLTALATAVSGVIGFVGLVVPHLVRLSFGPDHKKLLPLSMLGGAILVIICDLPTRFLGSGMRLGVITSLVGGPFLLWLLRKR